MWGVAHTVLTPERRVPNISACLWFGRRGHPQMSGWGLISAVSSRALEAWISWWFLFPELYLVSFNHPAWGCRGRQWWLSSCLETMRGTCSGSWLDLCLAKLSGFSSQPGSSNTTQEILMPVTSTTVLGIWQLRDWYGNSLFLSFTPTCYSFCKGCHFRGEMGEVSITRKKKKNTTVSLTREKPPDLPCERLPWPQVCSEHRGWWWVWKKSPTRTAGMSSGEPSVTEAGAEVVMGKKE